MLSKRKKKKFMRRFRCVRRYTASKGVNNGVRVEMLVHQIIILKGKPRLPCRRKNQISTEEFSVCTSSVNCRFRFRAIMKRHLELSPVSPSN